MLGAVILKSEVLDVINYHELMPLGSMSMQLPLIADLSSRFSESLVSSSTVTADDALRCRCAPLRLKIMRWTSSEIHND